MSNVTDNVHVRGPESDDVVSWDPASGEVIRTVKRASVADVDAAVAIAREALQAESRWAIPAHRATVLLDIGRRIEQDHEQLAELECRDTGKPIRQARSDVVAAARYFRYYGGAADKVQGDAIPLGPDFVDYTVREPWGVCGQIIPWNYPLQVASRCIAPALAAGNAVVLKPSELAWATPLELAELARQCGLGDGLLQVLPGFGDTGAALVDHPDVRHVTFVGSDTIGRLVAASAAKRLAPLQLELGGKSPQIVFADAPVERAVSGVVQALIQNAGQSCSAGSRLLVEESIFDDVVGGVAKHFERLSIGPGIDDHDLGPLISADQFDRASGMVERARRGATILVGGGRATGPGLESGFYLEPTLVAGADADSEIWNNEVFGPVLVAASFSSEAQAVELANRSPFGLVAGVWTRDVSRAHRIARLLEVGQVFVNTVGVGGGVELPFGGYKQSGYGRGKGLEALRSYTQTKNVCIGL